MSDRESGEFAYDFGWFVDRSVRFTDKTPPDTVFSKKHALVDTTYDIAQNDGAELRGILQGIFVDNKRKGTREKKQKEAMTTFGFPRLLTVVAGNTDIFDEGGVFGATGISESRVRDVLSELATAESVRLSAERSRKGMPDPDDAVELTVWRRNNTTIGLLNVFAMGINARPGGTFGPGMPRRSRA